MHLRVNCVLALLIALSFGCGKKSSDSAAGGVLPTPTPGSGGGANAMSLTIKTAYEDNSTFTDEGSCQVPTGTTIPSTVNCSIAIPEGRLHFSSLTITTSVDDTLKPTCEIAVVQPYSYQASSAAGFSPEWLTTAVDCSTTPLNPLCFSGVGVEMIPTFPQFRSVFFLTVNTGTLTLTASSARKKLRSSSNRWAANDLIDHATPKSFTGDGYVSNSMLDYGFECFDRWMQPVYLILLNLSDDDESTGNGNQNNAAYNQFPDWNSTLGRKAADFLKLGFDRTPNNSFVRQTIQKGISKSLTKNPLEYAIEMK